MKKFLLVCLAAAPLLASCYPPPDRDIGRSVLTVSPAVFLVALVLQYVYYRLWKRKRPELTFAWPPSLIFLAGLLFVALLMVVWEVTEIAATSYADSGIQYFGMLAFTALISFGPSFLTILLIVTRIGMLISPPRTYRWAASVAMAIYILPAFLLLLSNSFYYSYYLISLWWLPPGGLLLNTSGDERGFFIGQPGWLTVVVGLVLLLETVLPEAWKEWLLRLIDRNR